MPLAAAGEGAEVLGPRTTRSSAKRRPRPRRSVSLETESAPTVRRENRRQGKGKASSSSTAAAAPLVSTRLTALTSWPQSRRRRRRRMGSADGAVGERKRKRGRASHTQDDDDEGREAKKERTSEEAVPPSEEANDQVEEPEEEEKETEEDVVSSAPSSPICEPRIVQEVIGHDSNGKNIYQPIDSETFRLYNQKEEKFRAKLDKQMKNLPTLSVSIPSTCLDNPELRNVRQPATKMVLRAGQFVFGLSSSIGGKPLAECTGILIDWDERDECHETGIILTSAHIICSNQPSIDSWLCKDEYAPDAQVTVHFSDNTSSNGKLLYYQKHCNIALFSTKVKLSTHLPTFNENVNSGQDVFMLGRDRNSIIRINHGWVQFLNPGPYSRQHFMYTEEAAPECGYGGPLVDFSGDIVGMSTPDVEGSFIPSSIILKWLDLWRNYQYIPRPHLQLKLWSIEFLDAAQIEKIFLKYGFDEGLIVKEVSSGSLAEQYGIRAGDVLESLNGHCVRSPVELENLLLSLTQQHLGGRNNVGSKLDIELGIFLARKERRKTVKMTLNVTDEGEEIVRDYYPIIARKTVSTAVSLESGYRQGVPVAQAALG